MRIFKILVLCLLTLTTSNCSKDSVGESDKIDRSANLMASGDSANDILSNNQHTDLLIQIAYVEGFQPTQKAIDDFVEFIKERTYKEKIDLIYKQLPSPEVDSLDINKIDDLETENRTAYNDGKTLALYIFFADAPAKSKETKDKDLVTLGAVYRNTSMVIYESSIRELTKKSIFINNATVEAATLNHEFCHWLGLVDLGTKPLSPHEDAERTNHCNVSGCLMQSELEFGQGMMKMLSAKNSSIPVLGEKCLADLKSNGGR
ncbi:hypothetical protein K8352_13810 [Flavobacteriaceae bacterium F89]|uniref:Membrane metalloprotease n=1 Tax=Cerina litoralis TaxID=2874477 RepID=A0AAE3EWL0_9FLAO|nr:hypothetical protein [Cerina litoralis]MCG2461830.1 hypothetical protein [Cerina litoralis]